MIVKAGKVTSQVILEFEGVKGIDNKDSVLVGVDYNNVGSTYIELKQDGTGIDGVYKLNLDSAGKAKWYKL